MWFSLMATLEFSARPADVLSVPNSAAASAHALEVPKCMANGRLRAASAIASRLTATSWPLHTGRPNSGSAKSRFCLVIRLQLSTYTSTDMQSERGQSLPIRSRRPDAARNYRRCPLVQNPSTLPLACLHTDEYH